MRLRRAPKHENSFKANPIIRITDFTDYFQCNQRFFSVISGSGKQISQRIKRIEQIKDSQHAIKRLVLRCFVWVTSNLNQTTHLSSFRLVRNRFRNTRRFPARPLSADLREWRCGGVFEWSVKQLVYYINTHPIQRRPIFSRTADKKWFTLIQLIIISVSSFFISVISGSKKFQRRSLLLRAQVTD